MMNGKVMDAEQRKRHLLQTSSDEDDGEKCPPPSPSDGVEEEDNDLNGDWKENGVDEEDEDEEREEGEHEGIEVQVNGEGPARHSTGAPVLDEEEEDEDEEDEEGEEEGDARESVAETSEVTFEEEIFSEEVTLTSEGAVSVVTVTETSTFASETVTYTNHKGVDEDGNDGGSAEEESFEDASSVHSSSEDVDTADSQPATSAKTLSQVAKAAAKAALAAFACSTTKGLAPSHMKGGESRHLETLAGTPKDEEVASSGKPGALPAGSSLLDTSRTVTDEAPRGGLSAAVGDSESQPPGEKSTAKGSRPEANMNGVHENLAEGKGDRVYEVETPSEQSSEIKGGASALARNLALSTSSASATIGESVEAVRRMRTEAAALAFHVAEVHAADARELRAAAAITRQHVAALCTEVQAYHAGMKELESARWMWGLIAGESIILAIFVGVGFGTWDAVLSIRNFIRTRMSRGVERPQSVQLLKGRGLWSKGGIVGLAVAVFFLARYRSLSWKRLGSSFGRTAKLREAQKTTWQALMERVAIMGAVNSSEPNGSVQNAIESRQAPLQLTAAPDDS